MESRPGTALGWRIYAGLFLVALATMMYEILLTRIFSVTMWYHFAFMAISLAMFGMTLGTIIVYLRPATFTPERARYHLALNSLLFSVSIVFTFLTHLCIPFKQTVSILAVYSIGLNYVVISVPFIFSGICISLALTKFPREVSRLYAADLAGAAIGCLLLIPLLAVTDGPTAVIAVALLPCLGAILFGASAGKLARWAMPLGLGLAVFAVGNSVLVARQQGLLRAVWVKGKWEEPPLYEKWNSFSRIRIYDYQKAGDPPQVTSLSPKFKLPAEASGSQHQLDIDAAASTVLTDFHGDLKNVDYLRHDLVNFAHHLRPDADVMVVGAGGGRDILSALVFGQKSVTAVEINGNTIAAVNGPFGDFTGHLDRDPRVTFVNDEARSYIGRSRSRFDIIQISMIDTWAATSAGAYVLAENSLYTQEAWTTFLGHLTPRGILAVSRWYFKDRPGEVYRMTSLAAAALKEHGVDDPRGHIFIVRNMGLNTEGGSQLDGVGTMLVSREPLSTTDVHTAARVADEMGFEVVLTPTATIDPTFEKLAANDPEPFLASYPLNITPPTDDNPFFFNMLRLRDMFNFSLYNQGVTSFNMRAVFVLGVLLAVVVFLTLAFIIGPLILTTDKVALRGALPVSVFFGCIGLGFMFVEISQMQRLVVFLGHPTYGLSVVLFSLLLSSSLGSYLTQGLCRNDVRAIGRGAAIRLASLLCLLVIFGLVTPWALRHLHGETTPVRIATAASILGILGVFMGMPFPIGMALASRTVPGLAPWLWGINGATSVCASVLAVAIALNSSISATFWLGGACYGAALVALLVACRRSEGETSSGTGRNRNAAILHSAKRQTASVST
jgi:hypothetical protein